MARHQTCAYGNEERLSDRRTPCFGLQHDRNGLTRSWDGRERRRRLTIEQFVRLVQPSFGCCAEPWGRDIQ